MVRRRRGTDCDPAARSIFHSPACATIGRTADAPNQTSQYGTPLAAERSKPSCFSAQGRMRSSWAWHSRSIAASNASVLSISHRKASSVISKCGE